MLTRLQVRGFKSLYDVDIRFGPFTCVAGPNGVGKSNLFDAIRFLSLLTRHPIAEAVRLLRESKGRSPEPSTIFTAFQDFRASELSFAVEMIVDRIVEDDFGVRTEAAITALRYEVRFRLDESHEPERLELTHESLTPIKIGDAGKQLGFASSRDFRASCLTGVRRGGAFISTQDDERGRQILIHQDGHGGRKVPAPKASRTVLGGTASGDFPTVLAAHREMESWRTLMLEPSAMRAPSFYADPRHITPQGGNLPGAMMRLLRSKGEDVGVQLANRLAELIEEVQEVQVQDDERTEAYTLLVRGRDRVFHPARALSDGTLRFLVLATIALDPEMKGVLCLEEPENGIHPDRIGAMVKLLQDIAVDPQLPVGADNPLRQVIINTHSPPLVGDIQPDDVVYLDSVEIRKGAGQGRIAAARWPKNSWRSKTGEATAPVSPEQMGPYLGRTLRAEGQLDLWKDYIDALEGRQRGSS